jgi:hypothetical protein
MSWETMSRPRVDKSDPSAQADGVVRTIRIRRPEPRDEKHGKWFENDSFWLDAAKDVFESAMFTSLKESSREAERPHRRLLARARTWAVDLKTKVELLQQRVEAQERRIEKLEGQVAELRQR